jgi:hypothetical protein
MTSHAPRAAIGGDDRALDHRTMLSDVSFTRLRSFAGGTGAASRS